MYGVELYGFVRRAVMLEGLSHQAAARRFGIDRGTVANMIASPTPPGYACRSSAGSRTSAPVVIAERDNALERRAPEMALARDYLALAGRTGRTSGRQTGGSSAHDSRGLYGVSLREDENAALKWGRDAGVLCDDRSGGGEWVVHPAGELDDALLACPGASEARDRSRAGSGKLAPA